MASDTDRAGQLQARVQEDPCDQEAWDDLIDELKSQNDVTAVRDAYEALLAEFPTAVRGAWRGVGEIQGLVRDGAGHAVQGS